MARGWRRLMKRAGLQGVTPVTLRHSFASVADDLGFTRATVKTMLGHSTGDVTEGYIHKLDPVLAAAADSVAGRIYTYLTKGGSALGKQKRHLRYPILRNTARNFLKTQRHGGRSRSGHFQAATGTLGPLRGDLTN